MITEYRKVSQKASFLAKFVVLCMIIIRLKFLLQTVLSQSGSYYLIGTRVELDRGLVVNILSCARPLIGIFWEIGYS
jgi:hypothetical protein